MTIPMTRQAQQTTAGKRANTMRDPISAAVLCAVWIALSLGVARADPDADVLRGRVEDELLSDGISLERLGQRLELRPSGAALEVVLADRTSGAVVASRAVAKLPADRAAAIAQLTVVVSAMLREHGLVAVRGSADWGATFTPAAVVAYHRPSSVAVIAVSRPGRPGAEARQAALALARAYLAAGIATVRDGSSLGDVIEAEDTAIVARAAPLGIDEVAIVRAFLEGAAVRAVVTVYSAGGQLAAGFSALSGQALAAPAPAPSSVAAATADGSGADRIARTEKPAEPSLDKDGVVRLWVTSKEPNVQLLRTTIGPLALGAAQGVVVTSSVVCRAPCGTVVDGSLGETFTFGLEENPRTDTFQLLGHKGDVTAKVTPAKPGLRIGGYVLGAAGAAVAITSAVVLAMPEREGAVHSTAATAALIGGGVAFALGAIMYRDGAPHIAFVAGRPR
jgi:hypothetical protein